MPRRRSLEEKLPAIGDLTDPRGYARRATEYLDWLRVRQYSIRTVVHRAYSLRFFAQWAGERGITRPEEVTKPILERYQRHLFHHRKENGRPLGAGTQYQLMSALRVFFSWLAKENLILYNPASDLTLPRTPKGLPRHVLTAREVEQVLGTIDVTDPIGVRDRAVIEVLYSTGMRRRELAELSVYSFDVDRGTVMIRQGKGQRDRVVPVGERALLWVERYVRNVRPLLVVEPDDGALFLNKMGVSMSPDHVSNVVRDRLDAAEIGKSGSAHLFRHTMATLMLENGADVRFIQAMLGHNSLETTQIYTKVSIRKLKEIHTATHPARVDAGDADEEPAEA